MKVIRFWTDDEQVGLIQAHPNKVFSIVLTLNSLMAFHSKHKFQIRKCYEKEQLLDKYNDVSF